jgi:hypothetical protein
VGDAPFLVLGEGSIGGSIDGFVVGHESLRLADATADA